MSIQRSRVKWDVAMDVAAIYQIGTYVCAHDLVGLDRTIVIRPHRRRSRRMVLAESDLLLALNNGLGGGQKLHKTETVTMWCS